MCGTLSKTILLTHHQWLWTAFSLDDEISGSWESRGGSKAAAGVKVDQAKEMAAHSDTLAWKTPWMEEPGRLQSKGTQSRTRLSNFTSLQANGTVQAACVGSWQVCCCCLVTKLCLTLCGHMDNSPSGSSVHGIFQTRILVWVAIPFSGGSSWTRDWTPISCTAGGFFIADPQGKPLAGLRTEKTPESWPQNPGQECKMTLFYFSPTPTQPPDDRSELL